MLSIPAWGGAAVQTIMEMAEESIMKLGKQYEAEKPPDHLFAVIVVGLQVERQLSLLGGESGILFMLGGWAGDIRDYYLGQLKTKHDYRAFPVILDLEKNTHLLGGTDRSEEVLSVMIFRVTIDTSFDATWMSSGQVLATGNVAQNADVYGVTWVGAQADLWGGPNNLKLVAKSGTYKDHDENTPLAGLSDTTSMFLKNYDACVTKTFDVLIGPLYGDAQSKSGTVAGPAATASFEQYWWQGAGGFMFTVPMRNLNQTLGDQTFAGSGSAAEGAFTSNGQIHIVIKHTP